MLGGHGGWGLKRGWCDVRLDLVTWVDEETTTV